MKTRIIQREPEPEPQPALAACRDAGSRRARDLAPSGFFCVAVVGYFILGVVHPADIEVGDETTLYIGIHLVQPVFILLLAWGIWLLVKDLPGRAAQVARVAIVPYAIAYSMFDAIAGVALGQVVRVGERHERGRRRRRAARYGQRHGLHRHGPLCGVGPVLVRHGARRRHRRQADRRPRPDAADGDRGGDLRHRPPLPDRPDRHRALRSRRRVARAQAGAGEAPEAQPVPAP